MENKVKVLLNLLNKVSKYGKFYSKLSIESDDFNKILLELKVWYLDNRQPKKPLNLIRIRIEANKDEGLENSIERLYEQFSLDFFRHILFAQTCTEDGLNISMINYRDLLTNGYTKIDNNGK